MPLLNLNLEDPTFKLIFHESVCILAVIYFLLPILTTLREKKQGLPLSQSWNPHKNIVALYVVVAEPVFLYGDITTGVIQNVALTVGSQVLATIVVIIAYILLRDPQDKSKPHGPITKHKWSR